MEEDTAKSIIESEGYQVSNINYIPEGNSHFCFDIVLNDGTPVVARFEKTSRISDIDDKKRDFHYNGLLSLERERNLCEIVKNEARLPAPKVYEIHHTEKGSFMLVEKLSGIHWKDFLEESNYNLDLYLQSLKYLGSDMAQVQQVNFESYGDIMGRNEIQPNKINNFADRLKAITDLKLQRAEGSGVLNEQQFSEVKKYFDDDLNYLENKLKSSGEKPVLVLTDIHPMNFFVDDEGKPSGYFDLEFCQAGVPALEFYTIKFGLFNYFDRETFQKAETAFFEGFENNGGQYERDSSVNLALERTLSIGHLLAAVTSYHGAVDGLRDTWSEQFKDIMFDAIQRKDVNYVAIADVLRSKTKQPKQPTYNRNV
ncbi:phosphotransferase [Candidatus Woesearchaeota archaeon]|nr:phosphotransferase [Candidatus Woesearchaeota archaeon]